MFKHWPCYPKVETSSTATSDNIEREIMAKCCCEASGRSSAVESLLCYFKIKGSRPAAELAQVEIKWQEVGVVGQVGQWLNTCLIILLLSFQVLLLSWHK